MSRIAIYFLLYVVLITLYIELLSDIDLILVNGCHQPLALNFNYS